MTDRPALTTTARVVRGGAAEDVRLEVILEEPLSLEVNDEPTALLMRLPGMEKELAVGFCVSEGLVRSFGDVLGARHCGEAGPAPAGRTEGGGSEERNRVQVRVRPEGLNPEARREVARLVRAGCGSVDLEGIDLALPAAPAGVAVPAAVLHALPLAMNEAQVLRKSVGGVHAAGIFHPDGRPAIVCEDIGRHNAVDKAIGHCLLRGIPLEDKVLLCSGRLSYEMATKALRAGLPVLATIAVPTSLAVGIAERYGLTMIGRLSADRLTIYAHPERITT
jgi:FdhD protein